MPLTASITSWLSHEMLALHGPMVYVVVAALVFFEVAIVIGFFIPGEIAAIIGGVVAGQGHANVVLMVVLVVLAASVGNAAGFEVGQIVGPFLRSHRPLRSSSHVLRAEALIASRGGPAVLVGRFIVVVRALMPGIAGLSEMPRRTFLVYGTAGAVVWGTLWVLVGWTVGLSYARIVTAVGKWAGVIIGAAVVIALVGHLAHRRRTKVT